MLSQAEPQAPRNPSTITSHPRSEAVVNGIRNSPTNNQATQVQLPIPTPALELNLGQDEGDLRMPDWLTLVKPSPMKVIMLRRETHVVVDILLERLPRQPPGGYSGIKIPATASVRNPAETSGRPLEFRIYVTGATSNRRYETVCTNCEKREGKRKGIPNFIDFYAVSDVVEQKDGKARVEFVFCCYPKCHGDSACFLDVVLSEDVNQTNVVAQYRLPFSFRVVAKLPQGRKRPRGQMEQPEEPPAVDQRNVRARLDDLTQRDADNERNDHPMPAVNPRNAGEYRNWIRTSSTNSQATQGEPNQGQDELNVYMSEWFPPMNTITLPPPHKMLRASIYSGGIGSPASQGTCPPRPDNISSRGSTGPPPSVISGSPVASVDNYRLASPVGALMLSHQRHQAVNAVRDETAGGRNIVIMNANPRRGPMTGGTEIWIWGSDFPTDRVPLYARFGDIFARVVVITPDLLSCILPRANAPGTVPIALTHSPNPNAPVLGVSLCQFEYFTDLNEILPVMCRIQEDCTPEVAGALDILYKEMKKHPLERNRKQPL